MIMVSDHVSVAIVVIVIVAIIIVVVAVVVVVVDTLFLLLFLAPFSFVVCCLLFVSFLCSVCFLCVSA